MNHIVDFPGVDEMIDRLGLEKIEGLTVSIELLSFYLEDDRLKHINFNNIKLKIKLNSIL
jgi:hypothetical protein